MKCRVSPTYMEKLYSFYSPFYDHVFGHLLSPGRRQSFKYLDPRPHQKILEIGVGRPANSTAGAPLNFMSWMPPVWISLTTILTR